MSATPANVPSNIGLPTGAPSDIRAVAGFLTQIGTALSQWIAQAANALNYVLSVVTTAKAFVSTGGLNPTGTSGSGAMMGLGVKITPKLRGVVFMQIEASETVSAAATVIAQGRYGVGGAPSNGASPTGTAFANATWVPSAGSLESPFQVSAVISGLTIGTTYWIDLNLSTTAGTASVGGCRVNAFEI